MRPLPKRTKEQILEDLEAGFKTCRKCRTTKAFDLFHNNTASPDGRMSWCRECVNSGAKVWRESNPKYSRQKHLRTKYDITETDYDSMLDEQEGGCAICDTETPGGPWERFKVDHDHKTGDVRGLLCQQCNLGLGNFRDDVDLLQKAIEYLNEDRN